MVVFMLFAALATLAYTLQISILGYQNLSREERVAKIEIKPRPGAQQFEAHVTYADGSGASYLLAGDELYVDAHILKWHGWINLLGLHTMYELDRIGGRYHSLDDEFKQPRTLHQLSKPKFINAFVVRQNNEFLSPVVDAQYGSASFVPANEITRYDLMVSTSGLLLRRTN